MEPQSQVLPKRRESLKAVLRVVVLAALGTGGVTAAIFYLAPEWPPRSDLRFSSVPFEASEPLGPENPPSAENFRPVPVVARRPVVTGFEIVAASKSNLEDDELVLGVVVGGMIVATYLPIFDVVNAVK